jgi:secreted PhoX family phosphatase
MPVRIDRNHFSMECPSLEELSLQSLSRRHWLGCVSAALGGSLLPLPVMAAIVGRSHHQPARFGFGGVPTTTTDQVTVPAGYALQLVYAWGDALTGKLGKRALADASDSEAEQVLQAGMHHDGMHFFPFPAELTLQNNHSDHGLLCVNHEYVDHGLLFSDGTANWSAEKVAKSQAAHGVSVVELQRHTHGHWMLVDSSRYARRITANTPCRVDGPAAGSVYLQTVGDPAGQRILGTFNNCAMGVTPWGTYLTCEENFNNYFRAEKPDADLKRYGIGPKSSVYGWEKFDSRFDASVHPQEPNRFGWVVEIDPFNPALSPVKHTALGRFKHEGATVTQARDGRIVVYMGDDEQFEFVYKFVSKEAYEPGKTVNPTRLLSEGTLYVARFLHNGRGEWVPLVFGNSGLGVKEGFADQADILVRARVAATWVKATPMDRPEWIAVHPKSGEVYVSLTNNSNRGAVGKPGVDEANPRHRNVFGQIARWREVGEDAAGMQFDWDMFILAGDPAHSEKEHQGTIKGDSFGSPDGLWFDHEGMMWIQTDVSTKTINKDDYARLGNNQMLLADPLTGETRRFLTGPKGCEITGITMAPDGRTLFVNIQHPGEPGNEISDSLNPLAISGWPASQFPEALGGRPRSATVAITRNGGGKINGID